jgi:hypothetical protein
MHHRHHEVEVSLFCLPSIPVYSIERENESSSFFVIWSLPTGPLPRRSESTIIEPVSMFASHGRAPISAFSPANKYVKKFVAEDLDLR